MARPVYLKLKNGNGTQASQVSLANMTAIAECFFSLSRCMRISSNDYRHSVAERLTPEFEHDERRGSEGSLNARIFFPPSLKIGKADSSPIFSTACDILPMHYDETRQAKVAPEARERGARTEISATVPVARRYHHDEGIPCLPLLTARASWRPCLAAAGKQGRAKAWWRYCATRLRQLRAGLCAQAVRFSCRPRSAPGLP